jgi:hypothetical protein
MFYASNTLPETMCDHETFRFTCGHSLTQLLSYCHFARNDPYHQCFGVKVIKKQWSKPFPCQMCREAAARELAEAEAQ